MKAKPLPQLKIAVVNSKGGVAKTTSALYLAAAAAKTGQTVEILDLDRQGSASSWLAKADHPENVRATTANVNTLGSREPKAQVTIIDTSPSDQREIDKAAGYADFVVIPSMPGELNDERAFATWNYLTAKDIPAAILLVGAQNRRATTDASKAFFDNAASVFDTIIPNRSAIARSANHWPKQLFGYDTVLNDIKEAIS